MKTLLQTLFFLLLVTQICFAQWYEQNSPTEKNLNAVTFLDANNGFAVGDSGTILHTTNGGTNWNLQESGTTLPLNDVCFTDANNGHIVGGLYNSDMILRTTTGGETWISYAGQYGAGLNAVHFTDENNGWAVGLYNGAFNMGTTIILKTTDAGVNWDWGNRDWFGYSAFNDVYFVDDNTGLAVGYKGWPIDSTLVVKTTDGGVTWIERSPNSLGTLYGVSGLSGSTWFVVGKSGTGSGIVMRTTDGGITWDLTADMWGDLQAVHFSDSVNGSVAGRIGVPECPGAPMIHRTSDGGISWVAISSVAMGAGALMDIYFVGSLNGWAVGKNFCESNLTILHTTNGGEVPVELNSFTATANGKEVTLNWSTATELNNQVFEVQRKFGSNDFLTIGSVKGHGTTTSPNNYTYIDKLADAGKYFYRLKQIDYGGKYEYSQTVEVNWSPFITCKLEQNYPNPFNPTTTIGFGIPERGNVRLSVLNILGEEIKILLNQEKEAGYHSIDFNGSELPSGVYFYKLTAGSFNLKRKMLLLK